MADKKKITTYKGTGKDMKCRGKQYTCPGAFEEPEARACITGFHGCEAPLAVLGHYIRLVSEIGIAGPVKAHTGYVKSHATSEHTDEKAATAGDYGTATAGDHGTATAGDGGAATAGGYGTATAGDGGAATAGGYGTATAGDGGVATAGGCGAATAGDHGTATAGYRGAATAGDGGAATAGECGAATARGTVSVGKNGVGLVRGDGVKVRGGMGAILVIAEEETDSCDIAHWRSVVVDGDEIEADTWYKMEDGELVEAG